MMKQSCLLLLLIIITITITTIIRGATTTESSSTSGGSDVATCSIDGGLPTAELAPFLDSLLGPIPGLEEFLLEYWQMKPTVQRRNQPGYFLPLLSLDAMDLVITHGVGLKNETQEQLIWGDDWKMMKKMKGPDGEWWSAEPPVNIDDLRQLAAAHEAFNQGFSLVMNYMEQRWPPIANVAIAFEDELGYRTSVNTYLTPPKSQGFEAHFDWMDVYVLQVEGSKVWRLYDALVDLPRPDMKFKPTRQQVGEPFIEFELKAGDLLYLPAGIIHEAHTRNQSAPHLQPSLHVTIGVEATLVGSWESLIFHAITMLTQDKASVGVSFPPPPQTCQGIDGPLDLQSRFQAPVPEMPGLLYGDLVLAALFVAGRKDVRLRRAVPMTPVVVAASPVPSKDVLRKDIARILPTYARNMSMVLGELRGGGAGSITTRGFPTVAGEMMLERLEKVVLVAGAEVGANVDAQGVLRELVTAFLCVMESHKGAGWMMDAFMVMRKKDLEVRRETQRRNIDRCGYATEPQPELEPMDAFLAELDREAAAAAGGGGGGGGGGATSL